MASSSTPIPSRQLFIDGEWRQPVKRHRLLIINPTTEQTIGDIPAATVEDVNIAVEAARKAYLREGDNEWSSATGAHRAKYLRAIAAKVKERKSELAQLEVLDCGKPLEEAAWDILFFFLIQDDVARCFEYYADIAEGLDSKQKAIRINNFITRRVLREPLGVIGLITAWNYPLLMATWKVAPALAAGCTAILKPSEYASVTCLELGDICKQVGLPPGVLNILTGLGPDAGSPLVSHPDVNKIAFTGSSTTGSRIMTAAAHVAKPVTRELGGKSPMVVFEDVDLDKAAEWIIFSCLWTDCQMCGATTRLIVHESIANELLVKLKKWCENIKVSDPLEADCRLGPVSQGQYEKVLKFISAAKEEGATILCGGSRPRHLKKGFFIEPTIITDVTTNMQIWRKEVSGPVVCVKTFSAESEAIELANDTRYGSASDVLSTNQERCERICKLFQCGIVWVNCSQQRWFSQDPWGGKQRSGYGRERGEGGIHNYVYLKEVNYYSYI